MNIALIRAYGNLLAAVKDHCQQYHYLRRYPDPRSLPFAYVLVVDGELHQRDGRLNGLIVMKKPQHHKHRGLFGYEGLPTAWQVLDLARVWVHPDWQIHAANGHALGMFSRMVSLMTRQVQRDWLEHHPPVFPELPYHIELIISYADLRFHTGTAYRAAGFTQVSRPDADKALFYRRLKSPRWMWAPNGDVQLPLFDGVPLIYEAG